MVAYRFVPLARRDFGMLAAWLGHRHVAQWWQDPDRQLRLIREHFASPGVEQFVIHADAQPIGYLQCYAVPAEPAHPFGLQPPGTRGIDQFIGEPDMIDRGHGSALIRAFADALLADGVPRVVTDPDPANKRAVRAYEKAGFAARGLVDTPDGRTLLMVRTP